jgi:hypothetical protein
MHFLINLFLIFSVWRWGNWRNWKEFHATMVFLAFANMLYNFLTEDYRLWVMKPDILFNYRITEIIYTVIVLTGTTLIYLSRYPDTLKKQVIYNLKWIFIYVTVESILLFTGRIQYKHGWNLGWTVIFDTIMFPSLYLHYKRPLLAYIEFTLITILAVIYFKVPV